jgi:hypothetical protein
MFMKKEPVCRYGHDGTYADQELKDIGAYSAEHGHALQEFDPRFFHGDILARSQGDAIDGRRCRGDRATACLGRKA